MVAVLAKCQTPPNPPGSDGILWAATRNDVSEIQNLVRQKPSLTEYADDDGRTAMHYAACHGSTRAIQALFDLGASLDRRTSVSVTPVLWALEYRHLDSYKLLVSLGANLEIRRTDAQDIGSGGRDFGMSKYTVLEDALCRDVPEEYASIALDAGADPNAPTIAARWTPLMLSAIRGTSTALITKLIEKGARLNDRSKEGDTALSYAVLAGNADIAKTLLVSGASTTESYADNSTPQPAIPYALDAVRGGGLDCLKLVISFGASPNATDMQGRGIADVAVQTDLANAITELRTKATQGYTSAHFAVLYNHPEALTLLKKRGTSVDQPDAHGDSPLMIAAASGDLVTCDELIKLGADVSRKNSAGETCLHMAAKSGSASVGSLLIAAGASLTVKDNEGQTPHEVAVVAHNDLLAKLLATEAPPETTSSRLKKAIETGDIAKALSLIDAEPGLASARYGKAWTPLHFAAYYGHAKVARELAAKGATLDARSDTGWTPLMVATQQKSDDVVKALLQLKVDPNQRANNGRTALHVAAQENSATCVAMLLKAGAKVGTKDASGITALALAEKLGNSAAVTALRKYH